MVNNIQQEYNTRTQDITYPQHNLTKPEKSPFYMCIKFKNIVSISLFKKKVKKMIVNLEPYSLEDYFCNNIL